MENKNTATTNVLLFLLVGFIVGYFVGGSSFGSYGMMNGVYSKKGSDAYSGMHGAMDGMTMGLLGKTGEELEKAFLDGMIVHHHGAVVMTEALLKGTQRPELVKLGNDIIIAQTKEIEMMEEWRETWFK